MTHRESVCSSTIKLLFSSPPASSSAAAAVAGGRAVCLHVGEGWEESGVDVGAIGRALGVEPASVRLNGYLLGTRGPGHVAASVTWGSLLAFFAARGLPTGRGGGSGCAAEGARSAAADGPILVQGRPASHGSLPAEHPLSGFYHCHGCRHGGGGGTPSCKRKVASYNESDLRKEETSRRTTSSAPRGREDSVLCTRKKLRLDDEIPPEKTRKPVAAHAGPSCEKTTCSACTATAGFDSNCVVRWRKRSREEDMVVVALPWKRAA